MEGDIPPVGTPKRRFPAILGVAGLVLVLVGAGLGAYMLVRGVADSVGDAVPASSTFALSMSLAPSKAQASAETSLIDKFPATNGQDLNGLINQGLDAALSSKNLSHTDVRAWLGTKLAVVGGADLVSAARGDKTPGVAVIAESTDDSAATSMLAKLRNGDQHAKWSTVTHDGVTVNVRVNKDGSNNTYYAVFNHLVVVATTADEINRVIDTAHGNSPNLLGTADYKSAMNMLPSDNLGTAYFNIHALFASLKGQASAKSLPASSLQSLDAYKGAAAVLTAQSNGFKIAGTETFDPTKLSAVQRATVQAAPHLNTTLGFVPAHAFGFFALEGFDKFLTSLLDTFSSVMPAGTLNSLGITGAHGIAQKLTGDFGFEVDQATTTGFPVDGALLLGTTDSTAMQQFLTQSVEEIIGSTSASDQKLTEATTTYKGTVITSIDTGTAATLEASFAVYQGMAIVGGSVAEVERVIDTHDSGSNVTSTSGYTDAIPHDVQSSNGEFYADLRGISAAVREELPRKDAAAFDLFVAPITDHFTELSMTSQAGSDHSNFSLFVGIH